MLINCGTSNTALWGSISARCASTSEQNQSHGGTGLITLLQTTIGDRLPIIQGGSFAYLVPAFSIIAQIQASHTFLTEHDRFVYTMRELQVRLSVMSATIIAPLTSAATEVFNSRAVTPGHM